MAQKVKKEVVTTVLKAKPMARAIANAFHAPRPMSYETSVMTIGGVRSASGYKKIDG